MRFMRKKCYATLFKDLSRDLEENYNHWGEDSTFLITAGAPKI